MLSPRITTHANRRRSAADVFQRPARADTALVRVDPPDSDEGRHLEFDRLTELPTQTRWKLRPTKYLQNARFNFIV